MRPRLYQNPTPATAVLEEEEKYALDVIAAQKKMSTSAYLRALVLEHIKRVKMKKNNGTSKKH